jgi:chemotaxis family two-component system response regulator Rcp1
MTGSSYYILPAEILLAGDNARDVSLVREAFQESTISHRMHVVQNGEDVLRYLYQNGPYSQALRPDILLLDLNAMPEKRQELLCLIKQDPCLREIPVVVLGTANSTQDIRGSYQAYANAYIIKPEDPALFREVVEIIEDFWLNVVRLPPRRKRVA